MQTSQKDFYKKILGRAGEKIAVKFLKGKGYKILKTNYKTKIGEIDVIFADGEYTVFCEVKTRTDDAFGTPSQAVTREKQRKYKLVASEYLMKNKLFDTPCRFDVIEVEDKKINHIIDAFYV